MIDAQASDDELTFSLVRHDPWFVCNDGGLIPATDWESRRCLFFALVTWLPSRSGPCTGRGFPESSPNPYSNTSESMCDVLCHPRWWLRRSRAI